MPPRRAPPLTGPPAIGDTTRGVSDRARSRATPAAPVATATSVLSASRAAVTPQIEPATATVGNSWTSTSSPPCAAPAPCATTPTSRCPTKCWPACSTRHASPRTVATARAGASSSSRTPTARTAVRDLYLSGWYDYMALAAAGLTPWSPLTDRDQEARRARQRQPVRRGRRRSAQLRREARQSARPLARPRRPRRACNGRPRPAPLHDGRRRLHLPLRVEPVARRTRRGPRRGDDDGGRAPRGRAARALRHPRDCRRRGRSSCWATRWPRHGG